MLEDLKRVIEEKLPATTAGVMKDYLEKAERTEKELAKALEVNERLAENVKTLTARVEGYEEACYRLSDIVKREAAVAVKVQELANTILKIQLEAAIHRAEIVERLAETVFKNRTLTITKSGSIPMVDPNSGCSMTGYTNEQITQEEG